MNIAHHINEYSSEITDGLKSVNEDTFAEIVDILVTAFNQRSTIFVCGNGGSASIAEHFTCDHSKGISSNTSYFPKFYSLTSNVSLLTAYANDTVYDNVFASQLVNSAENDDVLIAISSSGNSPNIIQAIDAANRLGMLTISFTGFDGGKAKDTAKINIHIPKHNYGVVEDCHQIIMHMIAQYIRKRDSLYDFNTVKL